MTPVTINPTGFLANFIVFFLRGDSGLSNFRLLERWGVHDTCRLYQKLLKAMFAGAFYATCSFAYGFCVAFFLKSAAIYYMITGGLAGSGVPFVGTVFEFIYTRGAILTFITCGIAVVVGVGFALIYAGSKVSQAIRWFRRRNSGKPETPPSVLSQLIAAKREKICRHIKYVEEK